MARILIVDDDPDVCRLLAFKLEGAGHQAVVVHDGRSALEWLQTEDCALVLLDVMIPGFDGFYILRQIKETKSSLPVVMLTAKAHEGDVVRGLNDGANDYIVKPFSPTEVLIRCKRWLSE